MNYTQIESLEKIKLKGGCLVPIVPISMIFASGSYVIYKITQRDRNLNKIEKEILNAYNYNKYRPL